MGDGTGCDNMTAIIIKFKPALFELPAPAVSAEAQQQTQKGRKRSIDVDDAEAVPSEPTEKRPKIEDDLTPAAVDTSSTA